jgi:hypothetical protein
MGTTQARKHEAGRSGIDHRAPPPLSTPRHITRGIDHTFTWMGSSRTDDASSKPVLGKVALSVINLNFGHCEGGSFVS